MRKLILAAVLAAVAVPITPALADPPPWAQANGRRDRDDYRRYREYDRNGRYYQPRRLNRDDRVWRGRDGRYYC